MDDEQQQQQKKSFIKIPSYQEVFESSQPEPPPSLFKPSSSFSDAFSFIKSSEFYTAPPSSSSEPQENNSKKGLPNGESPSPSTSSSFSGVQNRNAILVSHRQKGNPLLKHIRNVNWMFADIVCDYLLGQNSCALYLSLRYHLLHPDYLYYRIRELQKNFKLRVVLCHIDVEDVAKPLLEVTRTALLHDCTLLCGWSLEECGRYLETIKVYENKPADIIQERMDTDYLSRLTHALTSIRHVNKSDVVTLGSAFGSLSHIMDASMEDLARCPGIGERKVKRLFDTFHEPFRRVISSGPTIRPENATGEGAEPGTTDKSKEVEEDNAKQENVPSLTVKSALTAAFAKYSEKIRKKKGRDTPTNDDEGGQSNADSSDN